MIFAENKFPFKNALSEPNTTLVTPILQCWQMTVGQ